MQWLLARILVPEQLHQPFDVALPHGANELLECVLGRSTGRHRVLPRLLRRHAPADSAPPGGTMTRHRGGPAVAAIDERTREAPRTRIETLKNYIGGQWVDPVATSRLDV